MREAFLFGMMDRTRERLLLQVEKCPVDKQNIVADRFNNSIQWQLGHILTVTDRLVFGLAGEKCFLPDLYQTFFGNGTKPADWTQEPPAWESIIEQLKEQPSLIRKVHTGKLNAIVKENFAKAEVVGELLQFNLSHESTHAGNINAMLKVLN